MQLAPLTFKSIRARAVVLKLKRPVVARIATITNIHNTSSLHWRGWLKPENRCLVPANSFAEYAPEPNPKTKKKDVVWFVLNDDQPLFAFAGIWTTFSGDRGTKSKPVPGPHLRFSVSLIGMRGNAWLALLRGENDRADLNVYIVFILVLSPLIAVLFLYGWYRETRLQRQQRMFS